MRRNLFTRLLANQYARSLPYPIPCMFIKAAINVHLFFFFFFLRI
jgi:hypothetical protein